ncbi:MAG: hypothetical protein HYV09_24250 [Deltaproteobacteria bacterium]|nr:hypothetical protein [Deltaproteobacteria bacterium]
MTILGVAMLLAGCVRGAIGEAGEEPGGFGPAAGELDASSPVVEPTRTADDSGVSRDAAEEANVVEASSGEPEDASVAVDGAATDSAARDTALDAAPAVDAPTLVWRKANLTWYTSYPDPGSEECIEYSGCTWAGQFAALPGVQPESWVKANNIAAVHGKDFETYKLKTLRLRQGEKQIDVKVYDMCADSDCTGCCTKNSSTTGFLIDIEKYTAERFGTSSGIVDWACLDC